MTCDKCGKELEAIKTDTGGAFLPCGCTPISRLITKNKDLCVGPCEVCADKRELAAALEIALNYLELISRANYVNNYDDKGEYIGTKYPHDLAKEALGEINEVCK